MIITIYAEKGGCGKTVLASALAAILSEEKGKRTLLIDLDTNGDCGIAFGVPPAPIAYQYFTDMPENRLMMAQQAIMQIAPNLDLLRGNASTAHLSGVVLTHPSFSLRVLTERFKELTAGYNYVIVDTAVGSGIMRSIAVEQANMVLVPLNMAAADIHKLQATLEYIDKPTWLVPSRVDLRHSVDRDLLETIREFWPNQIAPCVLPSRQAVAKAGVKNKPVVWYEPNADISVALRTLATFVQEKENND